jgi:His-Xaa-Ser system radical SAM maturase HxsB
MTALLPFRFREISGRMLLTSEGGDFSFFDPSIVPQILENTLTSEQRDKLMAMRVLAPTREDWRVKSLALQKKMKYQNRKRQFRYLLLVPTLRCNLACTYCQVSRAPVDAKGFDWDERHLKALDDFLGKHAADRLKIEFQGGEVSLRPDMIRRVEEIALKHAAEIELVACTNLFEIRPEFEALFSKPNFYISTSLDGDVEAMTVNRTGNDEASHRNLSNIQYVLKTYGQDKISFLPTITHETKGKVASLIDLYAELGASGIFIRPVNFMGFARKRHDEAAENFSSWHQMYVDALDQIRSLNKHIYFEEVYVADLVRKIFGAGGGAFIDFRSPADYLMDMAVIDFDGTIYPTDEARMLTRTRHVDLSVGNIFIGLNEEKLRTLNFDGVNETHPDCIHCAYLPYCGIDIIDDLSRYKRIDLPKRETWFCNKQTFFFDWIFDKVQRTDTEWLSIFARWVHRKANPPQNLDLFRA